MTTLTRIFLTALALLLVAQVVPGIVIDGLVPALLAAVVLGLLNAIVRPVLVVLTLPVTILTLGLFLLIINGALFALAAAFIDGFTVSGFPAALLGSLIVSIVSTVASRYLR